MTEKVQKDSLRDQIVNNLMTKAEHQGLGHRVVDMWRRGNSDKAEQLERQQDFLQQWDEFIDVKPQGLYASSSNLHIPAPLWILKTYHARAMQTLFNPEPQFSIKAQTSAFKEAEDDIHSLVSWTLSNWANNNDGIQDTVDKWVWNWAANGVSFVKWRWDRQFRTYIDVETSQVRGEDKFALDPDGREVAIPTVKIQENEVERQEETFNGPCLELRLSEDILVVGRDVTDTQNADAVIERQFLTEDSLNMHVLRGVFSRDAVDKIISHGKDYESSAVGGSIKDQREANAGGTGVDKDYALDRFEILEAYIKCDINGKGINSDIVLWVHNGTGTILRATYLHRINKKGMVPIIPIVFHMRSGNNASHPIGLVEMIYPLTKELDAMHNMRVDFGMISNMPFGFYRPSGSLDPRKIPLEPGVLIPVDEPTRDVYFPTLSNRTVWGMQEENSLMSMIEKLTGISDISLGVMTGTQGATRTATGSKILAGESAVNLDVPFKRLSRGWKKCIEYLLSMLQLRMPSGLEFRATTKEGLADYIRAIDINDVKGNFDIVVSPSSQDSNKYLQLQTANEIVMMQQDPLAIQFGIVTPLTYYAALKNKLNLLGIKDISKYLNPSFEQAIVLTPEEEFNRIIMGFAVPILPNMDHDGFINKVVEHTSDPDIKLNENQLLLLKAQLIKHRTMNEAIKMQQAQQANIRQMQFNSDLGTESKGGGTNESQK